MCPAIRSCFIPISLLFPLQLIESSTKSVPEYDLFSSLTFVHRLSFSLALFLELLSYHLLAHWDLVMGIHLGIQNFLQVLRTHVEMKCGGTEVVPGSLLGLYCVVASLAQNMICFFLFPEFKLL